MNDNFSRQFNYNNSGLGCFLSLLLVALLLGSVGLGWIVNGFLIFVALLILLPIVATFAFRWWLQRNLVEDNCPVCSYQFTGFNGSQCSCPSCGETLKVEGGSFQRLTPPGTIDVEAVEVTVQQIED